MKRPPYPLAIAFVGGPFLVLALLVMSGVPQLFACTAALAMLVLFGVVFVVRTSRTGKDDTTPFVEPQVTDVGAAAQTALRAEDPAFTTVGFLERVRALAPQLSAGGLEVAHRFLSDGLYQRLSTQRRLGFALPHFDEHTRAVVAAYEVSPSYAQLTVRLTVSLGGEATTHGLTFLRRKGVQSSVHDGHHCPHCGAPLELAATQRCRFCEAIVNSGAYDWVLCALTSGAHQLGRAPDLLDPDGVLAADPALVPQELQDRAALTFWRWVEARRARDVGRLSRVATAQFIAELDASAAPVGAVHLGTTELRLLRREGGFDEAHLLLNWSDEGEVGGGTRAHQTVFKLRRPSGVRTAAEAGLSTFRCTKCLAAMTDAEGARCEFCGAGFTDGWCLVEFAPFGTWRDALVSLRRTLGADWVRVATISQREAALAWLVSLAKADGTLTVAERARLQTTGARWQLAPSLVQACVEATTAPRSLELPRELALSLTQEFAELAFVDGALHPRTRKHLDALALKLGTQAELGRAIAAKVTLLRSASPSGR